MKLQIYSILFLLSLYYNVSSADMVNFIWINYTDVMIYKMEANESYFDDWKDYCRYPYICFGLYCDWNEVLSNETGECTHSDDPTGWPQFSEITYVNFKESYQNSTPKTNLQTYYNELKTGKYPLLSNQPYLVDGLIDLDLNYFTTFYKIIRQEENSMPFLVRKEDFNSSQFYFIDYECSLQYALNKFALFTIWGINYHHWITAVSIVFLLLVILIYAILGDLRRSLNGKCILIYSCLSFYCSVLDLVPPSTWINSIVLTEMAQIILYMSKCWLNLLCFDTFDLCR
jgi:hypothetical protein